MSRESVNLKTKLYTFIFTCNFEITTYMLHPFPNGADAHMAVAH